MATLRKHKAIVFGSDEDIKQEVEFKFDYYSVAKWSSLIRLNNANTIFVTNLEVVTPLTIEPSDLQQDLTVSIAGIVNEEEEDVKVDCLIEFKIQLQLKATA
jgi:hypothetical protein